MFPNLFQLCQGIVQQAMHLYSSSPKHYNSQQQVSAELQAFAQILLSVAMP